jgi:hypothetical protein
VQEHLAVRLRVSDDIKKVSASYGFTRLHIYLNSLFSREERAASQPMLMPHMLKGSDEHPVASDYSNVLVESDSVLMAVASKPKHIEDFVGTFEMLPTCAM